MLPPISHEPSLARLRGNSLPASDAAFWTFCRITPASTVMLLSARLISRIRLILERLSSTPPEATAAPHKPVLPPCGVTGIRCSKQNRMIFCTFSMECGCKMMSGSETKRRRWSFNKAGVASRISAGERNSRKRSYRLGITGSRMVCVCTEDYIADKGSEKR